MKLRDDLTRQRTSVRRTSILVPDVPFRPQINPEVRVIPETREARAANLETWSIRNQRRKRPNFIKNTQESNASKQKGETKVKFAGHLNFKIPRFFLLMGVLGNVPFYNLNWIKWDVIIIVDWISNTLINS